ncbi:PRD domain-containing protein [Actinomadura soli]|uniref:PRD domain-containing protein n=1 Tax=Actinomadura soli TaxID=2508997 RepID=A0A5C4JA18_9ACTN|nr:PRD domain-containing protein [Actinomadura soli]TMQ96268.1 PRD domain-containing protein [Actinomadura soli]
MDRQLNERLEIFERTGQVAPEVCRFVRAELEVLDATGSEITEESVGTLTSHLLLALQRARDGAALTEFAADDTIRAELVRHPLALERAAALAERAKSALDVGLPGQEVRFLALHLALLRQREAMR